MSEPFGDIYIEGERPSAEPIDCGEWKPETAYLLGDTVTCEGRRWVALRDYRSGILPPHVVAADYPMTVWGPA